MGTIAEFPKKKIVLKVCLFYDQCSFTNRLLVHLECKKQKCKKRNDCDNMKLFARLKRMHSRETFPHDEHSTSQYYNINLYILFYLFLIETHSISVFKIQICIKFVHYKNVESSMSNNRHN